MKIEKLNSWLTLAANFGVVLGLVFLGFEIQQNTSQLRADASYSINAGLDMMNSGIYNNSILADIVLRGEMDFPSLNPTERRQFMAYQFSRLNLAIHILSLEKDGVFRVHFKYVEFLIQEYQIKPGLQQFIASIEDGWGGSRELYDRLRNRQALTQAMSPEQVINNAYKDWVKVTNEKDIEQWLNFLAPDAVFHPPNQPALNGTKAIKEFYLESFADERFSLECMQEKVEISKAEDFAWTTGICESTFTGPDGKEARGNSKWAKVWVRSQNGEWKCKINSWSSTHK